MGLGGLDGCKGFQARMLNARDANTFWNQQGKLSEKHLSLTLRMPQKQLPQG